MEEFPSNSQRPVRAAKKEPKVVERVTSGEVVRRKKPLSKRFTETFVGGDARSVWGYVVMDVLIPAAKDMIADAGTQGLERMVFGESRSTRRRNPSNSGSNGYVAYNRFGPSGQGSSRREEPQLSRRARATHNFDEIILPTRVEAEEVIDRLFDIVQKYETATVADLYDLIGITPQFTDDKWGWSDIRGADVTRVRNGYLLDLPKPEPLER